MAKASSRSTTATGNVRSDQDHLQLGMYTPGAPAPYKVAVNFGEQLNVPRDTAVPLALDILGIVAVMEGLTEVERARLREIVRPIFTDVRAAA